MNTITKHKSARQRLQALRERLQARAQTAPEVLEDGLAKAPESALRRGLTLVELAIVLLVLGVIMAIVFSSLDLSVSDKAVALKIKNDARLLQIKISNFENETGLTIQDRESIEVLSQGNEETSWTPVNEDAIKDPWGNFYHIEKSESGSTEICTYGQDGDEGGEGKAADFCITQKSTFPAWLSKLTRRGKKGANEEE